jgi:hypothetical protein
MNDFLLKHVFLNLNSASEFDVKVHYKSGKKVCRVRDFILHPQDQKADKKPQAMDAFVIK